MKHYKVDLQQRFCLLKLLKVLKILRILILSSIYDFRVWMA